MGGATKGDQGLSRGCAHESESETESEGTMCCSQLLPSCLLGISAAAGPWPRLVSLPPLCGLSSCVSLLPAPPPPSPPPTHPHTHLTSTQAAAGREPLSAEYPDLPPSLPAEARQDKDMWAAQLEAEVVGRQFHRGSGDRHFVSVPTYPRFEGATLEVSVSSAWW